MNTRIEEINLGIDIERYNTFFSQGAVGNEETPTRPNPGFGPKLSSALRASKVLKTFGFSMLHSTLAQNYAFFSPLLQNPTISSIRLRADYTELKLFVSCLEYLLE